MDVFATNLVLRAAGAASYGSQEAASTAAESAANSTTTKAIINGLLFAQSKSIRTSVVILAAFNITAALATALSIIWDCHSAIKRNALNYKNEKRGFFETLHPAETFPLVLAFAIAVQGCVFAGSQGTGLQSVIGPGCATTAQFMLPAIFLVPFVQVVFGAEYAIRSLRTTPFGTRGKYVVPSLLVLIVLMEVGVWIPTYIDPQPDRCFASLAWFVTHFGRLSLILLSITGGLAIIFSIIIFYRLMTVTSIGQSQRIAASRMVYYLVLAIVSMAFVVPWFVTVTLHAPNIITSMMAAVVLNLTGLMTGLLHIFLRSNSTTTSFRPRGMLGWTNRNTLPLRLWGLNDLRLQEHTVQSNGRPTSFSTIGSRSSLIAIEKSELEGNNIYKYELASSPIKQTTPTSAPTTTSPSRAHARKQSYSIFPPESISPSRIALTAQPKIFPSSKFSTDTPSFLSDLTPTIRTNDAISTIMFSPRDLATESMYSSNETTLPSLIPPPPIFVAGGMGHKRDSSMVSSATVQIGLRLSNMLGPSAAGGHSASSSNASNTYLSGSISAVSSSHFLSANTYGATLKRPNSPILKLQTTSLGSSSTIPPLSQPSSSYTAPPPSISSQPSETEPVKRSLSKADRDARMKTLPPVPRDSTIGIAPGIQIASIAAVIEEDRWQPIVQLSPTVYSPTETRKGVAIGGASSSSPKNTVTNVTRNGSGARQNPLTAPPSASLLSPKVASPAKRAERASKLDWI